MRSRGVFMKRHTFAMEIREGKSAEFRSALGEIWQELTELLERCEISNFSLWTVERIVFGYFETKDEFLPCSQDVLKARQWMEYYKNNFRWLSVPFQDMRLMYHDYGIVRDDKELIRHRVFVTKLKPGMEEEYKKRHDALVMARGEQVTKGPDSNFTIWCAGGYIFGYNEIDTTMEHEMTEEERQASIKWETGMLEVMEWLTNDVDWITGECHPSIQRLGWHA